MDSKSLFWRPWLVLFLFLLLPVLIWGIGHSGETRKKAAFVYQEKDYPRNRLIFLTLKKAPDNSWQLDKVSALYGFVSPGQKEAKQMARVIKKNEVLYETSLDPYPQIEVLPPQPGTEEAFLPPLKKRRNCFRVAVF